MKSSSPARYSVCIPGKPFRTSTYGCDYTKQNVVAFEDRVRVECSEDVFFGGDTSRAFRSRVLVNPTWGTLFRVFKSQIKKTRDYHHIYLEGASYVRREVDKDGVSYGVVYLHAGS